MPAQSAVHTIGRGRGNGGGREEEEMEVGPHEGRGHSSVNPHSLTDGRPLKAP